tara:strand:+ start:512 stop:1237 length:726 start_codon:yes stop_codon:yes gene_type:complete
MTLPSSGAIGLNAIANEVGRTGNPDSLRTCSSDAGKGTPDAFTEFHGYSHSNPIPTSLSTRQYGSGLSAQAYKTVTAAIAICSVNMYFRLRYDGSNLIWEVKNHSGNGGSYWNAAGSSSSLGTSYVTLATWTGANAGMVDWSGSASGGGGGTSGSGSVTGATTGTGATYAAADATWRTLSSGQSMGWTVNVNNLAECYTSSTRYYTATFHNIYGRRSGYDDTSIGAFQVRCDATATSNNCF